MCVRRIAGVLVRTREGIRSEMWQGVDHMGLVGQLQRGPGLIVNTVGSQQSILVRGAVCSAFHFSASIYRVPAKNNVMCPVQNGAQGFSNLCHSQTLTSYPAFNHQVFFAVLLWPAPQHAICFPTSRTLPVIFLLPGFP